MARRTIKPNEKLVRFSIITGKGEVRWHRNSDSPCCVYIGERLLQSHRGVQNQGLSWDSCSRVRWQSKSILLQRMCLSVCARWNFPSPRWIIIAMYSGNESPWWKPYWEWPAQKQRTKPPWQLAPPPCFLLNTSTLDLYTASSYPLSRCYPMEGCWPHLFTSSDSELLLPNRGRAGPSVLLVFPLVTTTWQSPPNQPASILCQREAIYPRMDIYQGFQGWKRFRKYTWESLNGHQSYPHPCLCS